jgi:hypothetical protein
MEDTNTNIETEDKQDTTNETDNVTMTKTDYEKALQSAEDKVRTKYSKQLKDYETKIGELTPKQKSESEIELEKRLKDIEDKQKIVDAKEKRLNLQDTLQSKNLDKSMADYINPECDIDAFEKIVSNILTERMKNNGYNPTGHETNNGISKEKWKAMNYSDKAKLFETNPELAKKLMSI